MWALHGPVRTDPGSPVRPVGGVAVHGGQVVALGVHPERGRREVVLPPGAVVLPGLRDPHLHLRAMAAARLSVDGAGAADVAQLLARLAGAAADVVPPAWLRAHGYDEVELAEGRPPTAAELDTVTGAVPAVVHHRTGHAAVVNSAALAALGVPPVGAPGRDGNGVERGADGRPTGLLVDAHALLAAVPRQPAAELRAAVAAVGRQLAVRGVTGLTDATATNGLGDLALLASWRQQGLLPQRVHVLLSAVAVADAVAAGVPAPVGGHGGGHGRTRATPPAVRVVGAKVAAPAGGIAEQVRAARRHGWPVAVHATEVDELHAALVALEAAGPPRWGRDRIEHAGLVLPEHRPRLAAAGVAVVSNPAFLAERGSKYVRELSAVEHGWLYPVRSLLAAGVPVAAASDGPVTDTGPLDAVAAAVDRTVRRGPASGAVLGPAERVGPAEALAMVTTWAAAAEGDDARLRIGGPADLVVLDAEPRAGTAPPAVLATVVGGVLVARAAEGTPDLGGAAVP